MKNPMKYNLAVRINERNITKAMKGFPSGLVLDVGCGLGYITDKLSKKFKVIGLDVEKKSVKFSKENTDAMLVIADAEMLPFKKSSMNTVVASEIIEHLPHDEKFISELGRVTKNDAMVIITTPSTEGILKVSETCHESGPERHYRPGYTKSELERKLVRHFKILNVKYSMTLFTRIVIEVTKKAYIKKYNSFETQKDIFRVTDSKLFKLYKSLFPAFWIFIYIDGILGRFLKGSDIMIVMRRRWL